MMLGQPFGPSHLKRCDICCDPAAELETQNNPESSRRTKGFFSAKCAAVGLTVL